MTNHSNDLDLKKLKLSYQELIFNIHNNRYISSTPRVVSARLYLWDYWFAPRVDQNRFQDFLLTVETELINKDYEIKRQKRKKFLAFFKGAGAGATIVLGIFGVVKIVTR